MILRLPREPVFDVAQDGRSGGGNIAVKEVANGHRMHDDLSRGIQRGPLPGGAARTMNVYLLHDFKGY